MNGDRMDKDPRKGRPKNEIFLTEILDKRDHMKLEQQEKPSIKQLLDPGYNGFHSDKWDDLKKMAIKAIELPKSKPHFDNHILTRDTLAELQACVKENYFEVDFEPKCNLDCQIVIRDFSRKSSLYKIFEITSNKINKTRNFKIN